MGPWFERPKTKPPAVVDSVHYVSAMTVIDASRQRVWEFIKPPENSVFVSPEIVRGFRAPGAEGVGELQIFISVLDGVEQVSALEVVQEIPHELAVTRPVGGEDPAARGRTSLKAGEDGATLLEHGQYFTLPGEAAGYFEQYERHYKHFCRQYVERVKVFLEQPQMGS